MFLSLSSYLCVLIFANKLENGQAQFMAFKAEIQNFGLLFLKKGKFRAKMHHFKTIFPKKYFPKIGGGGGGCTSLICCTLSFVL